METDALDEFERRLSKTLGPLAATGHRSLLLSAAHAPGLRSTSRYVGLSAALLVVVVLAAARVLGPVGPAGTVATAAGQELRAQRDGDVVRLIVGSPTSVEIDAPLEGRQMVVWQAVCSETSLLHDSFVLFGLAPSDAHLELDLEGVSGVKGRAESDGTFVFSAEPLPTSGTSWQLKDNGRVLATGFVAGFATRFDGGTTSESNGCVLDSTDPSAPPIVK